MRKSDNAEKLTFPQWDEIAPKIEIERFKISLASEAADMLGGGCATALGFVVAGCTRDVGNAP
jgi:hypothetical protein